MTTDKVICANCEELTSPSATHCEWCYMELTVDASEATSATITADVVTDVTVVDVPDVPRTAAPSSRLCWRFSVTAARVPVQPLRNCPAVDDCGRLVACVQDELVVLSEAADGSVVIDWRLPTGGFIPGSPTIGADGLIRVHSLNGLTYCVRTDGQLAWEPVAVGEPLGWASPLVDSDGNTWISAYPGGLLRIDARGAMASRQFYRCASKLDSTGVIHNRTLFIGSEDQCVHAVDLSQERGTNRWDHLAGRGRTGWYVNTPLMMIDGPLIVATSRDDHLYAFHPDGREAWKFKLPGQVLGSPVASTDHRLYFGAAVGRDDRRAGGLVCLDTRTRQVVWTFETAAPVESTPVLGNDGLVYFGDSAGTVHAVDAGGRSVWTEQLPSAIRSAAALLPNGRVVFGSDDGSLTALRCEATGLAAGWPKHLGTAANSGRSVGVSSTEQMPFDPTQELSPNQFIGGYRIEAEIGRGGFGVVFRAWDTILARPVALKVLRTDTARRVDDLLNEARSAAALNHPHICTIHTVDSSSGIPVIVMELVDGRPLNELLAAGPLSRESAHRLAEQIASGLAAAHAAGVVHGDLKPANILVRGDGVAKLMDFGLSRRIASADAFADTVVLGQSTLQRGITGSPFYMSPEQARGEAVSMASDMFSFGLILYELLTSRRAITASALLEALHAVNRLDVESLVKVLDGRDAELLRQLLAAEPTSRPKSASVSGLLKM